MEASKVKVSPEYLRFERMGRNKRASLRRKNIIELIRNTPAGTPITLAQFQAVGAYPSTASAWGLVKTMLDRGTIVREQEGLARYSYSVAADAVKTRKSALAAAAKEPTVEPAPRKTKDNDKTLGDYAREFSWEHNSDSLRDFIKHMDGIELDVRRMISGGGGTS